MLLGFKIYSTFLIPILPFKRIIPSEYLGTFHSLNFLPLGLSFYTFQILSYLIDVYKTRIRCEKRFSSFFLYNILFPKVIAGPIMPYREVVDQLDRPLTSVEDFGEGIRRFMVGFCKKILIADLIAPVANNIFKLSPNALNPGTAWLGIIAFSLQIFYDFSGYSDMAVGLGKMMGLKLVENFNYPYISRSISEFWRRWHISLSNWFREYVFFPLERGRLKGLATSQSANIMLVFILTGLWHGITFNYIIWGIIHGGAIVIENSRIGDFIKSLWSPIRYFYTLLIILISWVFFRSVSIEAALGYLGRLTGLPSNNAFVPFSSLPPIEAHTYLAFIFGICFCLPIKPVIERYLRTLPGSKTKLIVFTAIDVIIVVLFAVSIVFMINSTFQGYIYFRF